MSRSKLTLWAWIALLFVISTTLTLAGPIVEPIKPVGPTTAPTAAKKTVRLLTIGNSFAANSTRFLADLAKADGNLLVLGQANVGGCSLERHWNAVVAAESNPPKDEGRLYAIGKDPTKFSLRDMLTREKWDIITIQQASALSPDYATYQPFANNLVEYVRKHAPQAKIYIHQTWAYRGDHPRFKDGKSTPEQMHQAIRAAYHRLAADVSLPIIPAGDAMFAASQVAEFKYVPLTTAELAALQYPTLPINNTLYTGYRWIHPRDDSKRALELDGFHAGHLGQYLNACVFYETLFGQSAVGNKFRPRDISLEAIPILQRIAHDTVSLPVK